MTDAETEELRQLILTTNAILQQRRAANEPLFQTEEEMQAVDQLVAALRKQGFPFANDR